MLYIPQVQALIKYHYLSWCFRMINKMLSKTCLCFSIEILLISIILSLKQLFFLKSVDYIKLIIISHIVSRGQFWLSGIVIACICVFVHVCVYKSLACLHDNSSTFKMGSPNLDQRYKTPSLKSLLFWELVDMWSSCQFWILKHYFSTKHISAVCVLYLVRSSM